MDGVTSQETGMSKRITDYRTLRSMVPEVVADNMSPTRWLDTGCGMGGSIRSSVERFPETEFTLADPNEDNLAEAKRTLEGKVGSFICAPTHELDIQEGYFDVITAILSHHYYSDRAQKLAATRNCLRMLRKGGMFVVVEHTRYDGSQDEADSEWRRYMESSGLSESSIDEMFARRNTVYFPYTEEEYGELLIESGFVDREVFWHTCSDIGFTARRPM
jgi:ubiquinone/menaquinone biosynthesis C-methylase UbiE